MTIMNSFSPVVCEKTNIISWILYDVIHLWYVCVLTAKSLQSCPILCDPIDGSPPGSPVHGILQARTLEWVAISFSNAWKWKVKVKSFSPVWPSAIPWTAAYQAPLSMGFSRQRVLEWGAIAFSCNQCLTISCPSLVIWIQICDPMDCGPPGSSVHGIFQARVLEWGAIAFSNATWVISKI